MFLVDTGAAHTVILDRDAKRLRVDYNALERLPEDSWACGIGGKVETFLISDVRLKFLSEDHRGVLLEHVLPKAQVLRHPKRQYEEVREAYSLLGMDVLRQYRLSLDVKAGSAFLEESSPDALSVRDGA